MRSKLLSNGCINTALVLSKYLFFIIQSFKDFCALSGSNKVVLMEDDVWTACKRIANDINEQQSQELFRLLDYNKDGYVTEDDWRRNINFDSNKLLKDFVNQIKRKNYKMSELLKIMKL